MSDTPPTINNSSPALGENSGELLAEIGITEEEQERLRKSGVIK